LRLIFIELGVRHRLGKLKSGLLVVIAHKAESVFMPDAWTDADTVKNNEVSCPVLAEKTRLGFSEAG
jgi:hypothetical protein